MTTTPCQRDPEKWVGDNNILRARAAKDCLTCPVLDACRDGAFGDPRSTEYPMVWAGVEYVDGVPVEAKESAACAACGRKAVRRSDGKFCSRECYHASTITPDLPREKACETCQEKFTRGDWNSTKWRAARFCSRQCAGMARRKNRAAA